MSILTQRRGMVLVFSLWVLTFLTVIAVSVAAGVRQKILLVKRLDERRRNLSLQETGVRFASAMVRQVLNNSNGQYSVTAKQQLHNDANFLHHILIDQDSVSVVINTPGQGRRFGVEDEDGKVNLNHTSVQILKPLIEQAVGLKPDTALRLAQSLLDWRQTGSSEVVGFFSDEYYRNLKFPYSKKDSNYQSLEELLLVGGVNKDIFEQLRPFVTVWGDGNVNINTASPVVLMSLGLTPELVDKIMQVRRGKDGEEATEDDYVFIRTFDIPIEINMFIKLVPDEIKAIDMLNAQGLLKTNSYYFTITTEASLANSSIVPSVMAVFGFKENKILWWHEK